MKLGFICKFVIPYFKGGKTLTNPLHVSIETTYSLNFLIYIQNIYRNQKGLNKENLLHPYIPKRMMFEPNFEPNFQELWQETVDKITISNDYDLKLFHKNKDIFYQRLFVDNSEGLKDFNDVYTAFTAWWNSLSGRISVERTIDDRVHKLYHRIVGKLAGMSKEPRETVKISLLYDDCRIGDYDSIPYFLYASIHDFFMKQDELERKILEIMK